MAKEKILFKFVGHAGRRELGAYVWSPENGHVCGVDMATAADLLTYPRPDFVLVQELSAAQTTALEKALERKAPAAVIPVAETLYAPHLTDIFGIGPARADELHAAGIEAVSDLAALDAAGIKALSAQVGANRQQLTEWNSEAKRLLEAING